MFPFFFYFWEQKRLKIQKKGQKNKKDAILVRILFDFFCYMELRHNTTMFRTPQKGTDFSFKKKEEIMNVQFKRWCILPSTFCGAHTVQKPASIYSWLVAQPLDLPHTPPFLSLSLNLSLALFTCRTLDLSHRYFY